jgi:hypothetical protein
MKHQSSVNWTLDEIKKYCIYRLSEIEMINHLSHTPSAFICIASFIAFLSELAYGTNKKGDKVGEKYRDFILRYLPKYKGYEKDLYETFRCGLVHSMSLYKQTKKGRISKKIDLPRVVLTHDINYEKRSVIQTYTENGFNAIIIYAFDMCEEIRAAIDIMFDPSEKDNPAYKNAVKFVKYQKPIGLL